MRNHRARGAERRADRGFRGTRFDAFCLRASQSIKNQMCLNSRRRFIFDNCLIMLRSATATKQLGDSVRRCQKTESGAATAPRHEERDWGRPPAACGGAGAPPHDMCAAARSSTSGVVGGVAHQRLERRTMHRQRERVRRERRRTGAAAAEQERLGSRTDHHQNGHFIRTRAELRRWGNRGPPSRSRSSRPSPWA